MTTPAANPTPSNNPTRRGMLVKSAAALGVSAVGVSLYAFRDRLFGRTGGYGKLMPAKDEATGLELIQLPKGFRYTSFGWTKDPLSDGSPTPGAHDGMAVVAAEGGVLTLIRNHELSGKGPAFGDPSKRFDVAGLGGCTTLRFDTGAGKLLGSHVSLSGTVTNCAGGGTPWGTWLSCEENVGGVATVDAKDKKPVGYQQEHGWVFEVHPDGKTPAKPIPDMGRFVHEAVAVDPATGIVYLTEDSNPSGWFRFIPDQKGNLAAGGKLEMMAAVADTRKGQAANAEYAVRWVPIADPARAHTPKSVPEGKPDGKGVFEQGREQGGTSFARLEGCFWANGRITVTATTGGDKSQGQVWEYTPGEEKLRLLFESPDKEVLNMPDNICLSPNGCVVLCEDGDRVGQRLHGLTPDGKLFTFAENNMRLNGEKNGFRGDLRGLEWAGVCFSPDGRWLFANLQTPGVTVAITGPWESGPL